jgi:hypothetical protein
MSHFSRDTQIAQYSVSTMAAVEEFDLITDYFLLPVLVRKWWNYHLIRATVCLRINVIAGPYVYGRSIVAFTYNDSQRSSTGSTTSEIIHYGGMTHIPLDAARPGEYLIKMPYTETQPYWDLHELYAGVSVNLPRVTFVKVIVPRDALTGGASDFQMTVSMHLEDIDFGVPVPVVFQSEKTQARSGYISLPASAISKATATLKDIPFIGPFAHAISIGSGAISQIARLFGFSKPQDPSNITTVGFNQFSTYAGVDQFRSLTLDPQQSVDMDPRLFSDANDPMSFKNVVGRYGIIRFGTWTTTTAVDATLFSVPVSPGLFYTDGNTSEHAFTPLAFGSMPYRFWRGSLTYKITFIASKYHRGRVRFYWTPMVVTTTPEEVTNSSYNMIVDLASTTEVEITVTWGVQHPYQQFSLFPYTATESTVMQYSNGILRCVVVDQLKVPAAAADILFLVEIKAGDDFELCQPTLETISKLSRTPAQVIDDTDPYTTITLYPLTEGAMSDAQLMTAAVLVDHQSTQDANMNTIITATFGTSAYNNVNSMYVGERFNSFRPLCKRGTRSLDVTVDSVSDNIFSYQFTPWWPIEPGYYETLGGTVQPYITWTFMGWLGLAFRGARGSTRVRLYTRDVTKINAARANLFTAKRLFIKGVTGDLSDFAHRTDSYFMDTGDALQLFHTTFQEITYAIPWQQLQASYYTYMPFDQDATPGAKNREPGAMVWTRTSGSSNTFTVVYSAGEDFTLHTWTGVPILYALGIRKVEPVGLAPLQPVDDSSLPPLSEDGHD